MAVDDHGIEAIRKAAEEMIPGSKADYYIKTKDQHTVADPLPVFEVPAPASQNLSIVNVTSPALANTEFTIAIPDATRSFTLRARTPARIQYAYVSGDSGLVFFTLVPGVVLRQEGLNTSGLTLYLQANKPSVVMEVEILG